jgi:GT2 family glycosyltransferase
MMIRREALEDIGPLDEGFFMYCEEIDWSIRAKQRGWKIYSIPSAVVVHHSGQSTGQFREKMLIELNRSRYRLFQKHYPPVFLELHRMILRAWIVKERLSARWKARRGLIDRAELELRIRAYQAIWAM